MENIKFLSNLKIIANLQSTDINSHIAKTLLKNINEIDSISLIEFAEISSVSKPSIMRFCKKIGVSGFSELKFHCKNLIQSNVYKTNQFNFDKSLLNKDTLYAKYQEILSLSSKQTAKNYFENASKMPNFINKINTSKAIYIFGLNLSYNVSRNFAQRIRWLSKNIIHENDLNSINSYVDQIKEDDIVLLISLSGNFVFLLDIAKKIKTRNVLAIGGKKEIIQKYCDMFLEIPQYEDLIWDSFSIRGQCLMQILDYIYMEITSKYF